MVSVKEKRAFPRLNAPLLCRPRGLAFFKGRPPRDVSLGGVRIYSDDEAKLGARLEVELFLPDESSITAGVEVVWVDRLQDDDPARFDLGLKFIDLRLEDRERLSTVLEF